MVLNGSLYGALIRSLILWRYLVVKLKPWGFHPKTYKLCITNKVFGGNIFTVCWHMDDLKISHMK